MTAAYILTYPWVACREHGRLPLRWWNEWAYCPGIGWHVPGDGA